MLILLVFGKKLFCNWKAWITSVLLLDAVPMFSFLFCFQCFSRIFSFRVSAPHLMPSQCFRVNCRVQCWKSFQDEGQKSNQQLASSALTFAGRDFHIRISRIWNMRLYIESKKLVSSVARKMANNFSLYFRIILGLGVKCGTPELVFFLAGLNNLQLKPGNWNANENSPRSDNSTKHHEDGEMQNMSGWKDWVRSNFYRNDKSSWVSGVNGSETPFSSTFLGGSQVKFTAILK